MSSNKNRWENKRKGSEDLKGRRRARRFSGTVAREFGPKPWASGEPPGGEISDAPNTPGPATDSTADAPGSQSQESSTSSE